MSAAVAYPARTVKRLGLQMAEDSEHEPNQPMPVQAGDKYLGDWHSGDAFNGCL